MRVRPLVKKSNALLLQRRRAAALPRRARDFVLQPREFYPQLDVRWIRADPGVDVACAPHRPLLQRLALGGIQFAHIDDRHDNSRNEGGGGSLAEVAGLGRIEAEALTEDHSQGSLGNGVLHALPAVAQNGGLAGVVVAPQDGGGGAGGTGDVVRGDVALIYLMILELISDATEVEVIDLRPEG